MLSEITYTASAGQTNFNITFPYLDREHVYVYINDVETTDYTFNSSTVIALDSGAAENDEVLIRRITPRDEPIVDYTNGANLGESDLDAGVLQNLFILQEIWEHPEELASSEHTLDSHIDGLGATESTVKGTMRVYNEDGKWAELDAPETGAVLIGDDVVPEGVRWLPKGDDGQILSVNDAVGGKLEWTQGFQNLLTGLGDILYASAVGVVSVLANGTAWQVLTARPGKTPPVQWTTMFSTGDGKLTLKTSADPGWVMMNDTSIGSASSGATGRANADTEDLYTLLWTNIADAWAPVATGRGASAAADFAANKAMTLPRQLGRALVIAGAGSGLTARTLGAYLGSEDAVTVTHTHTGSSDAHTHREYASALGAGPSPASYGSGSGGPVVGGILLSAVADTEQGELHTGSGGGGSLTIANAGEAATGKNMQPSSFWNVMVKL